jgi:hypothetical protein
MNSKTLLAAALGALLLTVAVDDVQAQSRELKNTTSSSGEEEDEDDRAPRESKKDKKDKAKAGDDAPKFPNATREDPKPKPGKLKSKLMALDKKAQSDQFAEVITAAEEILADPKANEYERGRAAYLAGFASVNLDDDAKGVAYTERAITENSLPNDLHFQLMQQVAQLNYRMEKYDAAIAAVDRYIAESKFQDPKALALKGASFYNSDRFAEAIPVLQAAIPATGEPEAGVVDMLMASYMQTEQYAEAIKWAEAAAAKDPKDKKRQLNLASVYAQAEQPAKAAAVFERLNSAGLLTTSDDYEMGYRLLANLDKREKDTIAFINQGLEKGILKPSHSVYSVLGQSYYYLDPPQIDAAIAAWEKGAPMSKDGELFLNLAKVNYQEERWAAAVAAAQKAIEKGLKKPAQAWIVIAGSRQQAGDNAGAIAAYREAAKDPGTREEANRQLKALGAK